MTGPIPAPATLRPSPAERSDQDDDARTAMVTAAVALVRKQDAHRDQRRWLMRRVETWILAALPLQWYIAESQPLAFILLGLSAILAGFASPRLRWVDYRYARAEEKAAAAAGRLEIERVRDE